MIIDDLPSGSMWIFCANLFISFFFQFVGFLLTYLLHTSHAAKFGSRAGLGLTLIQYGFYSRGSIREGNTSTDGDESGWQSIPVDASDPAATPGDPATEVPVFDNVTSRDWLSFLLMTLGK